MAGAGGRVLCCWPAVLGSGEAPEDPHEDLAAGGAWLPPRHTQRWVPPNQEWGSEPEEGQM